MKKKIDSLSASKAPSGATVEEVKPHTEAAAAPATPAEAPKTEAAPEAEKPAEKPAEAAAPAEATPPAESAKTDVAATPPGEPPAAAPDSFEALFPEPRVALGAPPSWLWWVLLLIVSAVLGVVGYALTQKNLKDWLSTSPTASPTASASASPTATPTDTPTPTATPTPTPTPVIPANVTMRVLNGTNVNGAAGKAKTTLEAAGYSVRTTGNASTRDYATTMVYYQAGRQAEAEAVQSALTGYSVTLQESTIAAPDMVLVVIGLK